MKAVGGYVAKGVWQLPTMETHGRVATEHEHQVDFVRRFRNRWPEVRIMAIPNGGKRTQREALRLKAEGVSPGVPDLFIPEWLLWVEMKRPGGGKSGAGKTSAEQEDWHRYLRRIGQGVVVCYTSDGAMEAAEKMAVGLGVK